MALCPGSCVVAHAAGAGHPKDASCAPSLRVGSWASGLGRGSLGRHLPGPPSADFCGPSSARGAGAASPRALPPRPAPPAGPSSPCSTRVLEDLAPQELGRCARSAVCRAASTCAGGSGAPLSAEKTGEV